jgi:hypothetical protein
MGQLLTIGDRCSDGEDSRRPMGGRGGEAVVLVRVEGDRAIRSSRQPTSVQHDCVEAACVVNIEQGVTV